MRRGKFFTCFCLILIVLGLPLFSGEEEVKKGARITGATLGLATVAIYSIGPFTGMDFQESPGASTAIVLSGSVAALGGSCLYSSLFANSILESKAGPASAGLEGMLAGALAGGMTNGVAFASMFAIGVPSGVIKMNEPLDRQIDTWYKGASLGFLGGFMYGMFFGALSGAIGGTVISFYMGF